MYAKHLYENSEGYIQILQLKDGSVLKVYNSHYSGIREIIESVEGEEDVFISPNTFYKQFRCVENIRHFRALYIDIDLKIYGKEEAVYKIYEKAALEQIPEPTMVVDSGRGIHLYWRINDAPYGALWTWQEIEDYLYKQLEFLGADLKATDSSRVMRLPSTYNSRTGTECKILIQKDTTYSMYELREKYLEYKGKSYQLQMQQVKDLVGKKTHVTNLFNSYSLHMYRIEDIKKLCELRNYDVEGHRNFMLHCFAYWTGIYVRNKEELEKEVIEFNNSFKKPLSDAEVRAVLKCVPKAIDKFLSQQQAIQDGVLKVTRGMKDKGGYWYKNKTLIERLDITEEEQKHLKTIIGKVEKYVRKNDKRKSSRRNKDGLTKREQKKRDIENNIKALIIKGYNMNNVAKELGINRCTISRYYKHLFA